MLQRYLRRLPLLRCSSCPLYSNHLGLRCRNIPSAAVTAVAGGCYAQSWQPASGKISPTWGRRDIERKCLGRSGHIRRWLLLLVAALVFQRECAGVTVGQGA